MLGTSGERKVILSAPQLRLRGSFRVTKDAGATASRRHLHRLFIELVESLHNQSVALLPNARTVRSACTG